LKKLLKKIKQATQFCVAKEHKAQESSKFLIAVLTKN